MNEKARQKFNTIYTALLTCTYDKNAGEGLLEMARLIDAETDKMSIKLLLQVLERNMQKASDLTKLDIAEELIGKQGEIASGQMKQLKSFLMVNCLSFAKAKPTM